MYISKGQRRFCNYKFSEVNVLKKGRQGHRVEPPKSQHLQGFFDCPLFKGIILALFKEGSFEQCHPIAMGH